MRVSEGFKALVLDNLTELGDVIPRSMFGGVGLYCHGLFFGIIAADVMYLKVDAANRSDFERAGMQPFKPSGSCWSDAVLRRAARSRRVRARARRVVASGASRRRACPQGKPWAVSPGVCA
jgi:TfoX/Sxy family transcriptional regulator of competence genes